MDQLAKLFGSPARLKMLRLFVFNASDFFTASEAEVRAKVSREEAKKELAVLLAAGIIKKNGGKEPRYIVNEKFEYLAALESFIRATTAVRPAELLAKLKKVGTLKVVVLSGLFTGATEAKADLLIVGDQLDERALRAAAAALEAELGREIRYASFSSAEFRYRQGVYDRLLRDIFDYPHRLLVDKIGL
jgi:hypothetical protein